MTAYEMRISDWSSDVCSSDLGGGIALGEDRVGCLVREDPVQAQQQPRSQFRQRLVRRHDVEVDIRSQAERHEHLVQHLPVDRKSVVKGKSVFICVGLGGSQIIKKKKNTAHNLQRTNNK